MFHCLLENKFKEKLGHITIHMNYVFEDTMHTTYKAAKKTRELKPPSKVTFNYEKQTKEEFYIFIL